MDDDDRNDHDLRELFAREQVHLTEQPFVNDVARRVAASRRRRTVVGLFAQAVAIGALIAASPWLLTASALLSAKLDWVFTSTARALDSPYGYGAGLLCFVAVVLAFRRRVLG